MVTWVLLTAVAGVIFGVAMVIVICCKNPVPCVVRRITPSNAIITPDNKALMFV